MFRRVVVMVAALTSILSAAAPAAAQDSCTTEPELPAEVVVAIDAIHVGLGEGAQMLDEVNGRMAAEKEAGLMQASPEVEADARRVVEFIFDLGMAWVQVDYVVTHLEAADVAAARETTPYMGDELAEAQQLSCALQQLADVALMFGELLPIVWALDDFEHIRY